MRAIIVSVGPLATASASNIGASQIVPGATALAIDGALSSGYSVNNIATTTGNGAATTTVTLNGSKVVSGVAYLAPAQSVVLVSAGNDSTKTWTVRGLAADNYTALTETVAAANISRVATKNAFSQVTSVTLSSGSAGNVSVGTNGVATMDTPRRVLLTDGGSDTGITFTISGTDRANNQISETITGTASSTAYTNLDFLTVTKIVASGASSASGVQFGTNGVASSQWARMDDYAMSQIAVQAVVTGTVNYTVQSSLDDPSDPTNPVVPASVAWVNSNDANAVSQTATIQTNYSYPPRYIRVLLNSSTQSAGNYVTATILQALGNVI